MYQFVACALGHTFGNSATRSQIPVSFYVKFCKDFNQTLYSIFLFKFNFSKKDN